MLYALQIVEALLEECSYLHDHPKSDGNFSDEDILKFDWVQRFMNLDGF